MGTVHSLLRALAESHLRTSDILARMNRHLARDLEPGLFVSMLLLRYDQQTGELLFTGAGHEHLVFYRPSTNQMEFMRAGGVVLGLAPELGDRLQERAQGHLDPVDLEGAGLVVAVGVALAEDDLGVGPGPLGAVGAGNRTGDRGAEPLHFVGDGGEGVLARLAHLAGGRAHLPGARRN